MGREQPCDICHVCTCTPTIHTYNQTYEYQNTLECEPEYPPTDMDEQPIENMDISENSEVDSDNDMDTDRVHNPGVHGARQHG